MPRPPREDYPGAWHHIGNRGIGKRTAFETPRDMACFLDALAEVRERGLLEVHAYSFLTTHFHLLARSPLGKLPLAMKLVEADYVRTFNRSRGRDGTLFRSRYWNRTLESGIYWHCVLRYIDRNPVVARLVDRSTDYPYGSAWWYARGGGPECLDRSVVDPYFGLREPGRTYPVEVVGAGDGFIEDLVRLRMRGRRSSGPDPLRDLVRAGSRGIQEWLRAKTRLADGTEPGWVVVSPVALLEAAGASPHPEIDHLLLPAMVRLFSGETLEEVGGRFAMSPATVRMRVITHARRLGEDPTYLERVATVLRGALDREVGGWGDPGVLPFSGPAAEPGCLKNGS